MTKEELEEIDLEWIQLFIEANKIGIKKGEIREFLNQNKKKV
ncbi:DNA-binding anti-repressor SinI [Neobacillus novalis]|uniref:DNA-binding anti-repressor SinI n=1 Tax=Neobacillus novalis TaxID=220687 RepID=A0AA95MTB3_9BACI|nr:DNA-binding anti-repressor SinI [Neobacillus novalis]WHY88967.1 DNA-binding anti-repressor SinI [Neobacillus novalis]